MGGLKVLHVYMQICIHFSHTDMKCNTKVLEVIVSSLMVIFSNIIKRKIVMLNFIGIFRKNVVNSN